MSSVNVFSSEAFKRPLGDDFDGRDYMVPFNGSLETQLIQ